MEEVEKSKRPETKYFRARYWDNDKRLFMCEVYIESSLEAAEEYAEDHRGTRGLWDVKEFPSLYAALTATDDEKE